jgi:CDP-diacylglycerol--serine O-phosphatidyltransferase
MTAGALCAGVASIYFAEKYTPTSNDVTPLMRAIALIGLAFVLDGLDGRLARLLKATSRFGERFDSISDFVAFGLAPAFILYRWLLGGLDLVGFAVVVCYALCAAIRLARFARQARRKAVNAPVARFFTGLPAPAAGFVVMLPLLAALSPTLARWTGTDTSAWLTLHWLPWVVLGHTVLISALMVSTVPMLSVKHMRVDRRVLVPLMLGVGVLAVLLAKDAWLTLACLAAIYLLSLPLAVRASKRDPGLVKVPDTNSGPVT